MKVGISVKHLGPPELTLVERAQFAESVGFDTIWFGDHIVNPVTNNSPYPYSADGVKSSSETPVDVFISMAFAAAATSRIEIGSGIVIVPLREPLALAKQVASIDLLSGGRITLGIGTGWLREEFDAIGADFPSRGKRTDDVIALLRAAWSGRIEKFAGQTYHLDVDVQTSPQPAHPVPIIIGGTSQAAMQRAGRLADGWYGMFATPPSGETVKTLIAKMSEAAQSAGRDPTTLRSIIATSHGEPDQVAFAASLSAVGLKEIVLRNNLPDEATAAKLVQQVHEL